MGTGNLKGVLFNNSVKAEYHKKIYIQRKMSLQACGNCSQFSNSFFCRVPDYLKRASLGLSVGIRASVSIEASVAIPVFLFCFLEVLSLLNYISVYSGVLYAMKATGDPVCIYGYAYDLVTEEVEEVSLGEKVVTSLMFSEAYLDSQIRQQCDEPLYENTIQRGVEGISLLGTYIDREDGDISIVAHYTMEPLISIAGTELSVICRYYGRMWTGYALEECETDKEYVYITDSGSVYHLTESCTYLKLSISTVAKGALEEARNNSGSKYKACDICCDAKRQRELYYITSSGTRYHVDLSCSGLKRTTYRVEKSEVEGWSACSRCGQKEE